MHAYMGALQLPACYFYRREPSHKLNVFQYSSDSDNDSVSAQSLSKPCAKRRCRRDSFLSDSDITPSMPDSILPLPSPMATPPVSAVSGDVPTAQKPQPTGDDSADTISFMLKNFFICHQCTIDQVPNI